MQDRPTDEAPAAPDSVANLEPGVGADGEAAAGRVARHHTGLPQLGGHGPGAVLGGGAGVGGGGAGGLGAGLVVHPDAVVDVVNEDRPTAATGLLLQSHPPHYCPVLICLLESWQCMVLCCENLTRLESIAAAAAAAGVDPGHNVGPLLMPAPAAKFVFYNSHTYNIAPIQTLSPMHHSHTQAEIERIR